MKFSGVISAAMKEKCRQEVADEVTAVSGVQRSAADVKKKWTCLKSEMKSKMAIMMLLRLPQCQLKL